MSTAEPSRSTLVRVVSRWETVGLSINNVVGSGIYLLPAAAAALLGAASLWAVLLAGLASALLVLCFAEASSYFEEPGGAYVYAREAFGTLAGYEVGWMTWLARVAAVASLSAGFALATSYLWPAAAAGWPRVVVITVPLVALTWINVVGVKAGARTSVGFVIAKMLPLAFFIIVGLFFVDWSRALAFHAPGGGVLGQAAVLLLFAYAGFENTPAAAGEYVDPRRDVPFALIMTILIVTLVYTGVQVVAVGTLPGLAQSKSPLAAAAGAFAGAWGGLIMSVGAMLSIQGTISNTTLIGPRYIYALARGGFGPRALGHVHPKHHTPDVAIITQSVLALALALSGSFVELATLSVIARLAGYIGTAAAVPVLRRRFGQRPDAFLLPGGATIPVAALLLSAAFVASTGARDLIAGGVALLVGAALYAFRRPADSDS